MRALSLDTPGSAGRPVVLVGAVLHADPPGLALADAVVVIRDGRIHSVGPRGELAIPPDAEVRDATGSVIVPGLIDAHLHVGPNDLPALLPWGITTAFHPAEAPEVDGFPALIATGPPLDGPGSTTPGAVVIRTAAEARAAVRDQAAAGRRAVKLYARLDPGPVAAAAAEARDLGLRVIADLARTSWGEAARAGVHVLCHAVPQHPGLLPRAAQAGYLEALQRGAAHPLVDWYARLDLGAPEVAETVAALREAGVAWCPTLVTLEAYVNEDPSRRTSRVMPGWPAVPPDRRRETWARVLAFVHHLHAAGVRILAGTDAPRPGVAPGASLHRELRLLGDAGLAPAQTLAAATSWAADALGLGDRGRVTPGLRADLAERPG